MIDQNAIEKKTEAVLANIGYKFPSHYQLPIKLDHVCQNEGITVKSTREDISGKLDRAKKVIYLNAKEPPVRQTFTLAHELGHYFLHKGDDVLHRHVTYSVKPEELEANHFAACLLMPKNHFITAFNLLNGNLHEIASHFGVSRPAAAFRADVIGGVVNEFC